MTEEKVKPERAWITYFKRAGYVAAALTALATVGFSVDGRYQKAEAADVQVLAQIELVSREAESRETGDVDNQIEIIQLELKYLANKSDRTLDDAAREGMLRAKFTVLLARQLELQK